MLFTLEYLDTLCIILFRALLVYLLFFKDKDIQMLLILVFLGIFLFMGCFILLERPLLLTSNYSVRPFLEFGGRDYVTLIDKKPQSIELPGYVSIPIEDFPHVQQTDPINNPFATNKSTKNE